jgi:hypothetical protein
MNVADVPPGYDAGVLGPGDFVGLEVCQPCFVDPAHRVRILKCHFSLPVDVTRLVEEAGSSTGIGA